MRLALLGYYHETNTFSSRPTDYAAFEIQRGDEIVRDHIRLTMQPFDAPNDADTVRRLIDHLPSPDMLLFASDFPHWQYDGDAMLPPGIDDALARKIMIDNPRAAYPRLGGQHAA